MKLIISADDLGLTRHNTDTILEAADRGALTSVSVLVNGELFVEGAPDEVARDPRVRAVYLGEAFDG